MHRLGGRAWSGRLSTPSAAGGTRHPLTLTAISISVPQRRSVVLWSLRDALPADSFKLVSHPVDGVLVLGANEILYVDGGGRMRCGVASNGFARATCPSGLVPTKVDNDKAAAGASSGSGAVITANPSPLPLLSVALDGCRISFVSDDVAALCLRDGAVYSLEIHRCDGYSAGSGRVAHSVSLSPMNCRLGGLGMVSTLSALPLATIGKGLSGSAIGGFATKMVGTDEENDGRPSKKQQDGTKLGVLFAGSRLGDSTLLLYGMRERVTLVEPETESEDETAASTGEKRKRSQVEEEEGSSKKREAVKNEDVSAAAVTDDEDIYRMEEEALYAPPGEGDLDTWGGGEVAVIAEDDGAKGSKSSSVGLLKDGHRPVINYLSVFDSPIPRAIDSLTGVGPLGPGTMGPTSAAGAGGRGASSTSVHPCGYGSSGGLAVLTVPGMNAPASAAAAGDQQSGTMVTEADCRDIDVVCGLSGCGLVLLGKSGGGTVVMKMVPPETESLSKSGAKVKKEEGDDQAALSEEGPSSSIQIVEVGLDELTGEGDSTAEAMDVEGGDGGRFILGNDATSTSILKSAVLRQATEWSPTKEDNGRYIVLLVSSREHDAVALFSAPRGSNDTSNFTLIRTFEVHPPAMPDSARDSAKLLSTTPLIQQTLENGMTQVVLGLVWSNGIGSVVTLACDVKKGKFHISQLTLDGSGSVDNTSRLDGESDEDPEVAKYYASSRIVAVDIFEASCNLFKMNASDESNTKSFDNRGSEEKE